jgi:Recombinase
MPYVHEMFKLAAADSSLYSIVQHLTKIGAPTPKCGKWHASTVRKILQSDTYLGTFWWGKERVTTTTTSVIKNGENLGLNLIGYQYQSPTQVSLPRPSPVPGNL